MQIEYDLLPKQKTRKQNSKVLIDLYPYATELYEELDNLGIIKRMREIPQLGVIKVKNSLKKTRFDYVMLQIYLHNLVKKNLQHDLQITYNNYFSQTEFGSSHLYSNEEKPSLGDVLQLLTIAYNIGHFYNTFTASRAIIMFASQDSAFYERILNASDDDRYQSAAKSILNTKNYRRLHLLNSILVLKHCDLSKKSVLIALEILYAYINENLLCDESKLKYAFTIFRNVRTVSYIAYDLQIAQTPLTIEICDTKAMLLLLKELLSEYNNKQTSNDLIGSITKILDDTVYNENSNAICYYKISRKMVSKIISTGGCSEIDYYSDWFLNSESVVNRKYEHKRDFVQSHILKITFRENERLVSGELLSELEKVRNTRVGYYDRSTGEQTILVSIKKSCNANAKRQAAFKTLKITVRYLRKIKDISESEKRFLLVAKFFLYYLYDENPVLIKPTINREQCVICTRGKNARVRAIKTLLNRSTGSDDQKHEVEFLLSQIKHDKINDTTITIPASIVVYQKDALGRTLCEFDGLIIHPMRKRDQVIFLEAKNRDEEPGRARKCLKDKFKKFSFECNSDDIQTVEHDAYWKHKL